MKMKLLLSTLLVVVIVFGITWGMRSGGLSDSGVVKIVTSLPMQAVSGGQEIVKAVEMALEEVDYKVGDYKVELVVLDSGNEEGAWQEDKERANAEQAVADKDVMIYFATYNSGAAKVSIPITNRAGLVQISPSNTNPGLTKAGFAVGEPGKFYPTGVRNYFRVVPTDAEQGPAGAVWAKELGFTSAYVIDDGDIYGKGIAQLFSERAKNIGIKIVGNESLEKETLSELVNKIKNSGAQVVYYGGDVEGEVIPFINEFYKNANSMKLMGPDGLIDETLITQTGNRSEGIYITTVGLPASELTGEGKMFYENYLAKYQAEPGAYSAFAYEAAKVVLRAIEKADKKDRAKVLNEMSNMGTYSGILGDWSFDKNGDTTLSAVSGMTVKNGEFVFVDQLR